jgi:hypothetical protein
MQRNNMKIMKWSSLFNRSTLKDSNEIYFAFVQISMNLYEFWKFKYFSRIYFQKELENKFN